MATRRLQKYVGKRDFRKTEEPPAGKTSRPRRDAQLAYVIQEHHARSLHYDLRLEWEGVLLSWAVPKGPDTRIGVRRLAVKVEDHPFDYRHFEGTIPKGQYGAGTVRIWDRGTWEPVHGRARVNSDLKRGSLRIRISGEKLNGEWTLTRMKGEKDQWLLIRRHSEKTRSPMNRGKNGSRIPAGAKKRAKAPIDSPETMRPHLAKSVETAPEGADWWHEIKYDGYRILAVKQGGEVTLRTRNGHDWTEKFREVANRLATLDADSAVLDGEMVVFDEEGVSQFGLLQRTLESGAATATVFVVFDLLAQDGEDLRGAALSVRKDLLQSLMARSGIRGNSVPVRLGDHIEGKGPAFLARACASGLEGIISKRASSRYTGRRDGEWRKVKCLHRQEFVIVGYTDLKAAGSGIGALVLAVKESGKLRFAGKVGTGFSDKERRSLRGRLSGLRVAKSPLVGKTGDLDIREVTWLRPEIFCEVAFAQWTSAGIVRHAVFQGLREDKSAGEDTPRDAVARPPRRKSAEKSGDFVVHGISITHPDREVFPEAGLTKADLSRYFDRAAKRMLPFIRGRALAVFRCPAGLGQKCFFQKHSAAGMEEIPMIRNADGAERIGVNSARDLILLAQFGAIEIHHEMAREDTPDRPDQWVFDLDPDPDVPWERVLGAAFLVRDELALLGLKSFAKLTGGKGVHLVVPLARRADFALSKPAAKAFASRVAARSPGDFTIVSSKGRRKGRIYIDWLRNGGGATAIVPFSPRARPHAPIAVPVGWEELDGSLRPEDVHMGNIDDRLAERAHDPWRTYFSCQQSLSKSILADLGVKPAP